MSSDEAFLDRLDPFADQIEWMARAFEISLLPYQDFSTAAFSVLAFRHHIPDFVIEHGRLPAGRVRLPIQPDRPVDDRNLFEVDLDALAAEAARACARLPLPETYRLPRRERARRQRNQIERLCSAFTADPHFDAQSNYGYRLQSFLENYVTTYERLPSGMMRPDGSLFPLGPVYDLGEIDFDALRRAAGIPNTAADVRHEPSLAPFEDQIEWMARAFDASLRPSLSGWPDEALNKMRSLKRAMTDHVRAHDRMPIGCARLSIHAARPLDEDNVFEVDFDALADEAAHACVRLPLPNNYRLPRHRRVSVFRRQITAVVLAFDWEFRVRPGAAGRPGGFWWVDMRYFLEDYVSDYERLPRGRMQADGSQIPLGHHPYDLGEFDFDAVRKAAGVPDDAEAALSLTRRGGFVGPDAQQQR